MVPGAPLTALGVSIRPVRGFHLGACAPRTLKSLTCAGVSVGSKAQSWAAEPATKGAESDVPAGPMVSPDGVRTRMLSAGAAMSVASMMKLLPTGTTLTVPDRQLFVPF